MSEAHAAEPARVPVTPQVAGRAGRRLKVMIVCSHYGPPWNEGANNLVRVLDEQLRARGMTTIVFPTGTLRYLSERPNGRGVATVARKFLAWRRAADTARREGVDVIHVMSSITSVAGIKLRTLRRRSGLPVVAHFTGVGRPHVGFGWTMAAERTLVGGDFLLRYVPEAESIPPLSPHVHDGSGPAPRDPASVGPRRRILFLGAMEPVRGVQTLVEALRVLRDDLGCADFTLTVAWNGYGEAGFDATIRGLVSAAGLDAQVRWEVGDSDVPALYRAHDVLVVPRLWGTRMSFPLRLVEAMSHGTPVIASDVGDMPRILEGCGLVFPRGDHAALAAALHSALRDDELYARMVRASLARAEELAPARTVDRIVAAYHDAIAAHRLAARWPGGGR
jgi:glycosyltransferase involved in cell wall biosynthesis